MNSQLGPSGPLTTPALCPIDLGSSEDRSCFVSFRLFQSVISTVRQSQRFLHKDLTFNRTNSSYKSNNVVPDCRPLPWRPCPTSRASFRCACSRLSRRQSHYPAFAALLPPSPAFHLPCLVASLSPLSLRLAAWPVAFSQCHLVYRRLPSCLLPQLGRTLCSRR